MNICGVRADPRAGRDITSIATASAANDNCAACPVTSNALDAAAARRDVPKHGPEVLFSVFTPGTHLLPHRGVTNTRVVAHLPLIVPPDCALHVGGEDHAWQEGRVVVFDDTYEHEAWNRSDQHARRADLRSVESASHRSGTARAPHASSKPLATCARRCDKPDAMRLAETVLSAAAALRRRPTARGGGGVACGSMGSASQRAFQGNSVGATDQCGRRRER